MPSPLPESDAAALPPWVREHIALFLTAGTVVLTAARLLAIAKGDPITATAVLQALGPGNALLGTLVWSFDLVAGVALVACVYLAAEGTLKAGPALVFAVAVLFMGIVAFAPWPIFAVVVSYALFGYWLGRRASSAEHKDGRGRRIRTYVAIVCALVIVLQSALDTRPWLPAEVISTTGDDNTVGYVLSSSAEGVTVLQESGRRVVYYDAVVRRRICRAAGIPVPNLLVLMHVTERSTYLPCPDTADPSLVGE